MATTTNYGWTTPDDTALVKDGASAIRSLGSSIDTTTKNLNPSTTLGDIEYRSSTANTNTRLAIGTSGQVLTVSGGVPAWATPNSGALVFVKGQTIGSGVSSVTVTNAFSATYDNYKIIISGGSASTSNILRLTLGATATGYYAGVWDVAYSGATGATGQSNTAFWLFGIGETNGLSAIADISQPYLSDETTFRSNSSALNTGQFVRWANGYLNNTTSYTDFTITASTGTFTGGTIKVYGYTNS